MTQMTINVAKDPELLDLMVEANFWMIFVGLETPNSITIVLISMLSAFKGTALWSRLERENRLLPELESGETCLETNFIPKMMSREELQIGFADYFKSLYQPENFYVRFAGFIDQLDLNRIKKKSAIKNAGKISNIRLYYLRSAFKIILYYVFHENKAMRQFFWKCARKSYARHSMTLTVFLELMVYFKAQNNFVEKHFSHRLEETTRLAQQATIKQKVAQEAVKSPA